MASGARVRSMSASSDEMLRPSDVAISFSASQKGCSSEIEVRLPGGAFDLESIAKAMGLTQRSVRTRLATSETSFSTILDQTRQRLATQYLIDTDLPLSTVSHLLGFSELSAFTRAARRWYGEAPRSYRQKARASHR